MPFLKARQKVCPSTQTQTTKSMLVSLLIISNLLTQSFCLMTCFMPSFLGRFCSCFGRCVTSLLEVKEKSFPLVIVSNYVEASVVFSPKSLMQCLLESHFWCGSAGPRQACQDVPAGSGAGIACAHSRMSAHKDSTASNRSICTSLVSSSGML